MLNMKHVDQLNIVKFIGTVILGDVGRVIVLE